MFLLRSTKGRLQGGERRQLGMDGVLFVMRCMCFVLPETTDPLICMSLNTYTHLLVFNCNFSLWQHRGESQLAVTSHLEFDVH